MDRSKIAIGGVVIALVAGAIGFSLGQKVVVERSGRGEAAEEGPGAGAPAGLGVSGENAIAVNDQLAGGTVAVAVVTFARDGWVVIHEDRDGAPGNILGAQRFATGANQTGSVDLLRPTENGKVYYAMLHTDDGDRAFDHTKDLPLADAQGNMILVRFVAGQ